MSGPRSSVNALDADRVQSGRNLGETEIAYYLPSRENGVNDMYLHLGFCVDDPSCMTFQRLSLVWSILRARHPLLAARTKMYTYDDIRFVYDNPRCPEDILRSAQQNLELRSQTKEELIDGYLNGERTLSNDRLSYLILSSSPSSSPNDDDSPQTNFDLLICAAHWIGDGMALHTFANELFRLLGHHASDESALVILLEQEFKRRYSDQGVSFPPCLEDQLPCLPSSKLFKAASKIDFKLYQRKLVGGHSFPKRHDQQARHTIVKTTSFDPTRTGAILRNCKEKGVSISNSLFAICSIAWARTTRECGWQLPIMMYTALNLRPYLRTSNDSYWFPALSYFNIVLPAFLPRSGDVKSTFWLRARSAKKQSGDTAKHPLMVARSIEMARERGCRARAWAKKDDGVVEDETTTTTPVPETVVPSSHVASTALIGLSLLGNLDGIYRHPEYLGIRLHTLTTGSRQRPGGMLLFGYTFVGKLWVSLGYDENGFDKQVVDKYWINVLATIDELLL